MKNYKFTATRKYKITYVDVSLFTSHNHYYYNYYYYYIHIITIIITIIQYYFLCYSN